MSGDVGHGPLDITMLQAMSIAEPMGVGSAKVLHGADLTLRGPLASSASVCFGSLADIAAVKAEVRKVPQADIFLIDAMGSGASEGDCRALPGGDPRWIE
jgi:hypothetical protein